MKKVFISFILALISITSFAQTLDKGTASALAFINQGYVKYGFEELNRIARTNGLAAQFYVAVCYENGIGTEKDVVNAFKMYRKAAERGLPDAMYHIASFYRDGVVVLKDANRESEWLKRFAQKGGKLILPDIIPIANEGAKHPELYAQNPNGDDEKGEKPGEKGGGYNTPRQQTINNVTIVQQPQTPAVKSQPIEEKVVSDVDKNIPEGQQSQEKMFALIIANENYQDVAKVPNALHDGEIFAEYCQKTFGIPKANIKYVADATLNGIQRQVNWIKQVMDAYQGEASVIFYYAGHGIPDESNKSAYILPVDGIGNDVTSAYSLDKLYDELSSKPAKSVVVLLDACFSGAKRDGGMIVASRGVAIRAKQNEPKGNMVILSAAQGNETAYPYKEKGHGMFTYYFLKKLQETNGKATLGEISDYVISEVKKRSLIINGKAQTPTVIPSQSLMKNWRKMKLK